MSMEMNKAPVEQAVGDERAAFELFVRKHCGMPEHIAVNWDAKFTNDAWEGWQARAALAQPSPAQAEAERPEVVGYRSKESGMVYEQDYGLKNPEALMTVAQHERIVGAHAGAIRLLADSVARLRAECNAALARVAELERQEPVATVAKVPGEDWNSLDFHRDLQHMQPGTKLYAAPVAQAQHRVPEGWMLVPIEPLLNMMSDKDHDTRITAERQLLSILAAAPGKEGV